MENRHHCKAKYAMYSNNGLCSTHHITHEAAINDLLVGLLVAPLISGDQAADFGQGVITMLKRMACGVAV